MPNAAELTPLPPDAARPSPSGGTGPPKADSPGPPSPAHTRRNNNAPDLPTMSPSGSVGGSVWAGRDGMS